MSDYVIDTNSPCTSVDAELTVRADYYPGSAAATFALVVSTTCPGGIAAGSPLVTVIINGETFGAYTSGTLPASITLSDGTIFAITGGFSRPRFEPDTNGTYSIQVQLHAIDVCGNSDIAIKNITFQKLPPNPKTELGSRQSGGYVEGDKAENIGALTSMRVEGFIKDYLGAALGADAGRKLKVRFYDLATGVDCPGYLIFDYSADVDMAIDLPTGGTGSPNYGVDFAPFITGGSGRWSTGATAFSGDFGIDFDKVAWAAHHGLEYSSAKAIGVSLEVSELVNGVDVWSNVATASMPIYCLEQHYATFLITSIVSNNIAGTISAQVFQGITTHTTPDWVEASPILWKIGNNSHSMDVGDPVFIETGPDPSGVNMSEIEFYEDQFLITFPTLSNDFFFPVECSRKYTHKDTGETIDVKVRVLIDYDFGTDTAGSSGALPVLNVNSFDQENCTTEIESIYSVDPTYDGVGGLSIDTVLTFGGQGSDMPASQASGVSYTETYVHDIGGPQSMFMRADIRASYGRDQIEANTFFQVKAI